MKKASLSDEIKFSTYMSMYRHYSNLRFILIPIYISSIGAIYFQYFSALSLDHSQYKHIIITYTPPVGCIFGSIFVFFELCCDKYITHFRTLCGNMLQNDELTATLPGWRHQVRIAASSIYVFGAFPWLIIMLS